jgi:transcription elongation factor Elf1
MDSYSRRHQKIYRFQCPICGNKTIEYLYVGDRLTRIGFLRVWCSICLKGVHISRVSIPKDINMGDFNDELDIPDFEQILP